ncbi:hypothetical protein MPL3356_110170 [Mesorhizobium plurifarium]|uniref:Uncharacterized protein n=1 Tax=Mesorhizobium plurifarium TaxID=69974 RepID=A0A090D9X1_MESPL|nr:hypothetical protein MPL3356_110170 [Mesorhizobium plurifarium]
MAMGSRCSIQARADRRRAPARLIQLATARVGAAAPRHLEPACCGLPGKPSFASSASSIRSESTFYRSSGNRFLANRSCGPSPRKQTAQKGTPSKGCATFKLWIELVSAPDGIFLFGLRLAQFAGSPAHVKWSQLAQLRSTTKVGSPAVTFHCVTEFSRQN